MKVTIPFSGNVNDEERQEWIESINQHSRLATLKPFTALSADERKLARLSVVADPDPNDLRLLPNLEWIQSLWAGVEKILGADIDTRIRVVRLTDPMMAESMAQAVLSACLYLHLNMPHYRQQQNNTQWSPLTHKTTDNCNVSIFGLGKLGTHAAIKLQQNHFTVRGWSHSKKTIEHIETFHATSGLQQLVEQTDIAVVLLPLTSDTESLFNHQLLSKLPTGASIINFARGPIIVEQDLINHLDTGHIDHAVLDVFNKEPLPADHPLWTHPRVTVLPHISGPTTVATAAVIAAQNIDRYLAHGTIPDAVDRARGY